MALEQRVGRLERALGGSRKLHFLPVGVRDDETKQEAYERAVATAGLRPEDIGLAWFGGCAFGFAAEDYGGYSDPADLVGWTEFWIELLRAAATSWRSSIRKPLHKRREARSLGLELESS
jgi:hypothetical protein